MASAAPFTGQYFHAIDAKSRLTIPSKLREVITPREQTSAFYAVVEYDGSLSLYPPEVYRSRAPHFGPGDLAEADVRNFQRLYYAMSEYVEVDRLGRVLLPERLLARCGIKKNVAIIGADDHIQIWDEQRWKGWLDEQFPARDRLAARVSRRPTEPQSEAQTDAPPEASPAHSI